MITINDILQDAKDLDTYIQLLDRRRRETQQDNPLVRRLLGQLLASIKSTTGRSSSIGRRSRCNLTTASAAIC